MVDKRKKQRRAVDCAVSISWRDDNGSRTTTGRALDVCDSGVRVELTCSIERSSQVVLSAEQLGLIGGATVRHCSRRGSSYILGLELDANTTGMGKESSRSLVDYYEVLQISQNAEPETIKRVYKLLAMRLHPDNPVTGDAERFRLIKEACDTLTDAQKRAAYDCERERRALDPLPVFEMADFAVGVDGEVNRRLGILCLLYNSRRTNEDKAGLSLMDLEKLMGFPREHLAFAVWYLKSKQYVTVGEASDNVITSEGVDYVESHLGTNHVAYALLKSAENGTTHRSVDHEPVNPPQQARSSVRIVQ